MECSKAARQLRSEAAKIKTEIINNILGGQKSNLHANLAAWLLSCLASLIVMHVQSIPKVNANAAITNCAFIDI